MQELGPGQTKRFSIYGESDQRFHIRGGNEMGEKWREDGMLMKKKNTFQDFVDTA